MFKNIEEVFLVVYRQILVRCLRVTPCSWASFLQAIMAMQQFKVLVLGTACFRCFR